MNHNKTIARLLAKENLTIQHGNYKTAWFDIKNRTLGLPLWKDMPKDTYDLFIGHEVGHALYTPYEGWHDSPEKIEGVPRSYMNVIEDARIERFVQNDYPGLVGPFRRGYMDLLDREFFGDIDDLDYDEVKLIDKINLKAKLGDMIEVPFSPVEKGFFDRAFTTTTFDEVVQLCREILAYTQENQSELLEQPDNEPDLDLPEGEQEMEDPSSSGHDDYMPGEESDEEEQTNAPSSEDSDDGEEEKEGDTKSETSEDSSDEPTEEAKDGEYSPEPEKDADTSITDEIFRRAEKDLIEGNDESGGQPLYMREPNQEVRNSVISSYQELKSDREKAWKRWYDDTNTDSATKKAELKSEFGTYYKQVKKSANYAVKEFEMRKAAYQWSRAQTAKSGSLDVNKVWSYKTNEDIFARVTNLADAKNHGMIMFIDFSGSMSGTLQHVLDQLIHLVVFCKAVNIPFDVYAFTTIHRDWNDGSVLQKDGEIAMSDVSIPLLISSSLKKKDFEEALFGLYLRKVGNEFRYEWDEPDSVSEYAVTGKREEFGSTPLNDALVLGHRMVKEFKAKHAVQKMNLIVLSDGDSNSLNVYSDHKMNKVTSRFSYYDTVLEIDGKQIRHDGGRGRELTKVLLENIQKRYGCRTLGFFVSDSSHNWNNMLWRMDIYGDDRKEANKEYRKFKCVSKENVLGYDNFYLVKGHGKLSTDSEEFNPSIDDSIAKIRSSFKKFSSSKKNNKTILTNFGKAVA